MLKSAWSTSRDLKSASTHIAEFAKSQLTEKSTNWVGEDVMIVFVQDMLRMAACQMSWSRRIVHGRMPIPNPLYIAFILDRFLLFHVVWSPFTKILSIPAMAKMPQNVLQWDMTSCHYILLKSCCFFICLQSYNFAFFLSSNCFQIYSLTHIF